MIIEKTNIQELFENIEENNQRIILFGNGGNLPIVLQEVNDFLHLLSDSWKTPAYISGKKERYLHYFRGVEYYVDYLVDSDYEKCKNNYKFGEVVINTATIDILENIVPNKYIILITSSKYEMEIKSQLDKIDNLREMKCYAFFTDLHYYSKKNRGLIVERIMKPYIEMFEDMRYGKYFNKEKEEIEMKKAIENGKCVINTIAFDISTCCNLNCKYCTDYIPSLAVHKYVDVQSVLKDIEDVAKAIDICLVVELTSGEAILHPKLDVILDKLLSIDKFKLILIVTNGMQFPKNKQAVKLLANSRIIIEMSDYNRPEITNKTRRLYKENGINVKFLEGQRWFVQGQKPYDRRLNIEELNFKYLTCGMARMCPQRIINGKLYGCGKLQRFAEMSYFDSTHDVLNFEQYEKLNDLKTKIMNFKLEPYMLGCGWCDVNSGNVEIIKPAEQNNRDLGRI